MAEDTQATVKRLARAIRDEAGALERKQVAARGEVREARPGDIDYQRGVMDGHRSAADLLDDGSG